MNNDIVTLTKKFVTIPSTQDNVDARDDVIALALSHLSRWTIERFEKNGIQSVLVFNRNTRPEKFKVILNGHLDVVPGNNARYIPDVKDNRLYGVGSLDMKASVACLISVFNTVADQVQYPLALQIVTDEEIGGFCGTKYQIEQGVNADFVLAAEPTNFHIVNKAKGILHVKITAPGTTAHGAYPWRGTNAIWEMHSFLSLLKEKFPIPDHEVWKTTVNVANIETRNNALNKIPDDCTIWLDIRFIPEDSLTLLETIRAITPKNFQLEVEMNEPSLQVDQTNNFIQCLQKITGNITGKEVRIYGANGSSDARHYTQIGTNGIEFGPVGGNIGADDEWVDLNSLTTYCDILKAFLLSY